MSAGTVASTQRPASTDTSDSGQTSNSSRSGSSASIPRYAQGTSETAQASDQRAQAIEADVLERREGAGVGGELHLESPAPEGDEAGEIASTGPDEESSADEEQNTGESAADEAEQSEETGSVGALGGRETSSNQPDSDGDDSQPVVMLVAELPGMAPIRAPHVGSPPREAVMRREQIIKRTGAPPELNHAQVRQSVHQVTQFARDQQRRMLFNVGDIAGDLRSGIEEMADEVAKATTQAVGQVNARMDTALGEIKEITESEAEYIRKHQADVSTDAQKNRDKVTSTMYAQLSQGSKVIEKLRPQAEAIYGAKLGVGLVYLPLIPLVGEVERVPPIGEDGIEHPEGDYKTLTKADAKAGKFINTQAEKTAKGKPKAKQYISDRARAVLNGRSNAQRRLLQEANSQAIERLSDQAVKDGFMIRVLGMTTPAREDYDTDAAKARHEAWEEGHNELDLIQHATEQAVFQLEEKQRMAEDYCKEELRPKLTSSLRKQGDKAEQALRKQARQAEIGLNTAAAHMAEDYRNLIARLDELLPPGQFFDARKKVPQVMAMRDSLVEMLELHEQVAETQSEQTRESHLEIMRDQIEALMKAARDSVDSIGDVVTRIDFDMGLFAQQTTGEVREEAEGAYDDARALADETARSMLSTNDELRATAAENIGNAAAALINQHIHSAEFRQFRSLDSYVEGLTEGQNNGHLGAELVSKNNELRSAAAILNHQIPERDWEEVGERALDIPLSNALNPVGMAWDALSLGYELYETDPEENNAVATLGRFLHPGPGGVAEHFRDLSHGSLVTRIRDRVHNPQKDVMIGLIQAQNATAHAGWAMYGISNSAAWYNPWALNRGAREALGSGISEEGFQGLQSTEAGRFLIAHAQDALSGEWWQTGMNRDEQEIALAYVDHNRERVIAARAREAQRKGQLYASFGFIFTSQEAVRRTEDARIEALENLHRDLQRELEVEAGYVSQDQLAEHLDMMFQEVASLDEGRGRGRKAFEASQGRESLRSMATRASHSAILGVSPALDMTAAQLRLFNTITDREPSELEERLFGVTQRVERTEISDEARDYIDAMIDARPGSGKGAERSRRDVDAARRAFTLQRTESSTVLGQYGELMDNFGIPGASELRPAGELLVNIVSPGAGLLMNLKDMESLSIADQNRMTSAFQNPALDNLDRQIATETDPAKRRELQQQRIGVFRQHQQTMQDTARQLGADEEVWRDPDRATTFMRQRVGDVFARADTHAGDSAPVSAIRSGWQAVFGNTPLPFTTPEGYSHRTYGEELIDRGRASIEASTALASEGIGTNETMLQGAWQNRSAAEWAAARAHWKTTYGESIETSMGIQGREMTTADWVLMAVSPASWALLRGGEVSGDLAMELERHSINDGTDRGMLDVALLRDTQQRVRGTGILGKQFMEDSVYADNLEGNRAELGRLMLQAVAEDHPELFAQFENKPAAIFDANNPDGQRVLNLAFDENRRFRGDRMRLAQLSGYMEIDAQAYSNELDRQERIITGAIAIMAMIAVAVVTVIAMLIPGVNVAVAATIAGVASAIIAGTATMAVKAGMRGERYGWEEAATDTAMMMVEAAAAGVGGALAGGAGSTGIGGVLGRVGSSLTTVLGEGALGKAVSAAARESAVALVSGMAQTALQDGTWDKGFARGLENMVGGGMRSAAVAAVTAGVSEGISDRFTNMGGTSRLFSQLDNMPPRLRASTIAGRSVFAEAASEFIGTVAGETVGVGIDYGRGVNPGFWNALQSIGEAALRDATSGAIRGTGQIPNLHREYSAHAYRHTIQAFRDSDVPPTREQLAASLLLGRSGGILDGGADIRQVQYEIHMGRELFAGLPTALRGHARGFEVRHLQELHNAIRQGAYPDGSPQAFRGFFEQDFPGLDSDGFMQKLDSILARRREPTASGPGAEETIRVREAINAHVDADFQRIVSAQEIDGLQHLSPEDLARAAKMIAGGVFQGDTADLLFSKARQQQPDLDEATFLSQLMGATHSVREARELRQEQRAQQHRAVMANLDDEGRQLFSALPHEQIAELKAIFDSQTLPSAHERMALLAMARRNNPDLSDAKFQQLLESGMAHAADKQQKIREAARSQRERHMLNIPEEQRGILSALPDEALIDLRIRQQQGEPLTPHEVRRLLDGALRETPDVDLAAVERALHKAMEARPESLSPDREARLRAELTGAIPRDQRAQFTDVPILIMRDGEFEAFTRSQSGQAVTLIIHGRAVVVMRESADPGVLREEGIHVLQSKDPEWADRVGALDERTLADWDTLPLAEQLMLYRNKLALEVDAQQRLLDSFERDLVRVSDPAERAQLQAKRQLAEASLGNLMMRAREVASIGDMEMMDVAAGHIRKPDWLDQPARLFSKKSAQPESRGPPTDDAESPDTIKTPPTKEALADTAKAVNAEIKTLDRDSLIARLEQADIAGEVAPVAELLKSLPPDTDINTQRKLAAMALLMREAGMGAEDFSRLLTTIPAPGGASELARKLADRLPNLGQASERKKLAERLLDLVKMQPALKAMDVLQFQNSDLKGRLNELVFGEATLLDAVWGSHRAAHMSRLENVLTLTKNLSESQLQRLVDLGIRPNNVNTTLKPLIDFIQNQGPRMTSEGLDIAVNFFFENRRDFSKVVESIAKLEQVIVHQEGGQQLVTDALKAAAFMKQSPNMIIVLTHIASAIGRHDDASKLFASFDEYIKAASSGKGNLDLLSSLQKIGNDLKDDSSDKPRLNEAMINALTNKNPISGTRPTPQVDADLKRPDSEFSADSVDQKSRAFVESWHKFMIGTFSPDGYNRDFTVSDSYKRFYDFLVHEDGFNLPAADVQKALQRALAEAAKSGRDLTVEDVRHAFKEQFKDQIMRWILYNDPKAKIDEVEFDGSDPEQVKESLKRLEALSTHGLNVKDRGNLAEEWYAAYRESLSGSELATQAILRESENKTMVGPKNEVDVPSTPSTERKPDFAEAPILGDVKSHKGALSKEDEVRLRAYLRAVSNPKGAQVRIDGELSKQIFNQFRLVFTNANGAVSSSSRLMTLMKLYPGHFSFVLFNPHTGLRHEVDFAEFSKYKSQLEAAIPDDGATLRDEQILKKMLQELSAEPAQTTSDSETADSDLAVND